jgi:hypothetical protein
MKYELGFYIPEDDILHSHCREYLNSYVTLTGCALYQRRNVSPVQYVFWDIKTQFVLHRRHITSPLQSPAS